MIKNKLHNPRFPHKVVITRLSVDENPFSDGEKKELMYKGVGRSYTDTTVYGDAKMDYVRRKTSVPVRWNEWKKELMAGDIIAVKKGAVIERGTVRDWKAGACGTIILWEYPKV